MPDIDPLDDLAPLGRGGVPRDRWERPLLYKADGTGPFPYTSASTVADTLADDYGLNRWDRRMIAKGVGMDNELSAMAGSSTYSTALGERDQGKNREAGRLLDEIVERGRDRALAHQKRDWGTAFHQLTEDRDPLGDMSDAMRADVESFWEALDRLRITVLATEVFVAWDELMIAGTFDHLAIAPWAPLPFVIDKKTGVLHPEKDMVQLTPYARGDIYEIDDDGNHKRTSFAERFGMKVDTTFGITAHTPALSGKTTLYPHDLDAGYESAKLAMKVREHRKAYKKSTKTPQLGDEMMHQFIKSRIDELDVTGTASVETMKVLYQDYKDVWTEELSSYGWAAVKKVGKA